MGGWLEIKVCRIGELSAGKVQVLEVGKVVEGGGDDAGERVAV